MTCQLLSIGIIAVGSLIPGTAMSIAEALRRSRQAHACAQMGPLWQAIAQADPQLTRRPPRRPHRVRRAFAWLASWCGNGRSLQLRVVQIRDGYQHLQPWLDAEVAQRADGYARTAGLRDSERQAVVEAATIATALAAQARGDKPATTGRWAAGSSVLTEDVRWLVRVSQAFAYSPVVARVLVDTSPPAGVSAPASPAADVSTDGRER